MRIIRGKYKGRTFYPEKHFPTRPTTDYAKEGLFNILENSFDFEDVKFLDLFCGTGNISYEICSRGCRDITCIDNYPGCVKFVKETAERLGMDGLNIYRADVKQFIENCTEDFDLIFAGPPYAYKFIDKLPDEILGAELLKKDGWFILEHSPNHNFEVDKRFNFSRNYGKTIFSIFALRKSND